MQPFSPHNRFFSSLHQLEQRLSSENPNLNTNVDNTPPFSSPLHLLANSQPSSPSPSTTSSLPPRDFITSLTPTTGGSFQEHPVADYANVGDVNIMEELVGLLGLSVPSKENETYSCSSSSLSSCGFYRKVVGVKGPRCGKERERLDGWVEMFYREKREPARFVHLMIGKAVSGGDGGDGFEGMEFPASVEEVLERDPGVKGEMEGGE